MIDLHENLLMEVFGRENPQKCDYQELTAPPLAACLGIVGVWGMLRKSKTAGSGYELRPEWAEILGQKPRHIKICFDSDSEWNVNIGHAASQMAETLRNYGMDVEYISIPSPPQHKLGADDYLIEEADENGYFNAAQNFYNLVRNAEPITGGVSYAELMDVTKRTKDRAGREIQPPSAIGYLKQKYRQSLVQQQ
jgi:hypothetical protein